MRINNRKLPRLNRRLFCRNKYSRIFYVCTVHRTVFLTLRPSQVQVLGKEKKSPNRLFFLWSSRQDSPSAAAAPCILMARRPSQATVPVSPLHAKNSPPDCFLNAQTFSDSSPWQRKKSLNRLFFLWSRRQVSPSAAAAPCILMARRPSQATVPVSPLLAKNSPPDCFLNAQTFSGSSPWQRKKEPQPALFSLVEATGLEPAASWSQTNL